MIPLDFIKIHMNIDSPKNSDEPMNGQEEEKENEQTQEQTQEQEQSIDDKDDVALTRVESRLMEISYNNEERKENSLFDFTSEGSDNERALNDLMPEL